MQGILVVTCMISSSSTRFLSSRRSRGIMTFSWHWQPWTRFATCPPLPSSRKVPVGCESVLLISLLPYPILAQVWAVDSTKIASLSSPLQFFLFIQETTGTTIRQGSLPAFAPIGQKASSRYQSLVFDGCWPLANASKTQYFVVDTVHNRC